MPRAFGEEEKEQIQNFLIEKGKELFSLYGFKKTGVSDLTSAAGIAQGSFYLFFNSKEELYFEIMEREEKNVREKFVHWLNNSGPMTRSRFREFLRLALNIFQENHFLRRLMMENELTEILKRLPPDLMDKHAKRDAAFMEPLIRHWQETGVMIDSSPDAIAGVIRSLFILPLYQKEIGEEVFTEVMELYISSIACGLIMETGQTE